MLQQQGINVLDHFRQNPPSQQLTQKKEIFKFKQINLPSDLNPFERKICDLIGKLFSCQPCFNFQSKKEDQLCDICTKTLVELEKSMFVGIFEKEKYLGELSAFWKTGNNIKVYCGKILKINDVGYKCYDCEMDPTCIICKECFEKGDHRGHRTVIQKGCSGCCDCGDIEAWKKEGFCSDHKGFLTKEQLCIDQIDPKYRANIIRGFKILFYNIFSQIEDLISKTQNGQQIKQIQDNLSIQKVVEYTVVLIDKIVMKNTVLQNLFNHILCEIRFDEDRFKLRHICPDIISRVTIGDIKTHPLQKCQCSILELMLRYIVAFNDNVQEKIKNFFISMFNLYHFKQNLITAYTKSFNFFYYFDDSDKNKDTHPYSTNFIDLNVQLFTSDILAGYVLDQKTEDYIIDYYLDKNLKGGNRTNSMNEKAQHRKDSESNTKQGKSQSRKNSEKIQKQETQQIKTQSEQSQEVQEEANQEQEEERKEQQIQFEEIDIEQERQIINQTQQQENNDEDFETEEDEENNEDGDEEYDDEDDDDDEGQFSEDDGQYSEDDNLYMDMEQDEQIDDSLPLFDCDEQKNEANQIQKFVNEYYFGNILDKLLLFASYSFKQKSVVEQFFKTFQHVKYISQKEFSLSKLIEKDIFRDKFVELLAKMHYKIDNKLKRKFETIYANDYFFSNACTCEKLLISILKRIVSYLHSIKKEDQNKFNKIHIDYMKLIMKQIIETTEKYEKQQLSDISSMHIPLHRSLIILIMSFFKFDFNNINTQSLNQLARSLNLDYELFGQFFLTQLKYPLSVVCFIKELDCGVWNFHGEEFKYLSQIYISHELKFQAYDTLFFQFVLKMSYHELNLEQISNIFSSKKEFYDIINKKIINNKKDNSDFLEKNEKVLGEFFSFIVYCLLDQVSLYSVAQSILKNTDQMQAILQYTNPFVSSFMHQFKSASIQEVQESLMSTFGKQQDLSTFLMQVCTFNKSTKKFSLMENHSKLCEPNFFYWSPLIKSAFHDKTFQKYQNSKEIYVYLLGNAQLNQAQKAQFKYICNVNSLSFIEDLIRQPFISKQFQQKKSLAQQHLVAPILKLILLFIQNQDLYSNYEVLESHVKNILTFLIQFKDNFVKELVDTIQYLQDKLQSSNQLFFQKDSSNQDQQDKEDTLKKKEQMKKRQEEILKLFQQRSTSYSEKNKDDLKLEKIASDGECCVICKKSLDEESEFGYGVYCQKTNIYEFSQLKGFIQQNFEESVHQSSIQQEANKNYNFWNLREGNWYVNSCFHHIHKSCYQQYLYTKNKQKTNMQKNQYYYEHEYKCPLCNRLLNSFLTTETSLDVQTLTESFSVNDCVQQSHFQWSQLASDSSAQIQTEVCEMNKASNSDNSSTNEELNYKLYKSKNNHLEGQIDYHFLSTQIETINITQYEQDFEQFDKKPQKDQLNETSDEKAMGRIENILLNHLRITDFDCSPNTLISQPKKLQLLRQILMNLNVSLGQQHLESFYLKRQKYCRDIMNILQNINLTSSSSNLIKNHLLENDLKEAYTRFLFYSFNYFNSEKEALKLVQQTIIYVLIAKFIQTSIIQQRKKQQQINKNFNLQAEEISTFDDNESCQYVVDILQRTWNLLSLFFEFDTQTKQNLSRIFDDFQDEMQNLLKFMNVSIPSKEQQIAFIQKCIKDQFDHNHLNILKITPNNTSFNFVSFEHNFNDLFKKYQLVKCSLCKDVSKYANGNPTMCLICGDVLCSITCKGVDQINSKGYIGNLNSHAKKMHFNSSIYLDLVTSQLIYVSYPHNCQCGELYFNNFGIPFKKSAKDWSQFQLDNNILNKLHQNAINLEIVDQIKLNEVKTNILYKYHFF